MITRRPSQAERAPARKISNRPAAPIPPLHTGSREPIVSCGGGCRVWSAGLWTNGCPSCRFPWVSATRCASRRSPNDRHVMLREILIYKGYSDGGRYWVRTSDPCRVKAFDRQYGGQKPA